jgi:hypothetical protein
VNDQPTSSNRWEPSTDATPTDATPTDATPTDATPTAEQPQVETPAAQASAAPRRSGFGPRMRGFGRTTGVRLGAFALVIFVIGGAGGFGLAQLTSHGRSNGGVPTQRDARDGLPGDDHRRGFDGPRGTPPGQAPDEGTPGDQPGTSNDGLVGGGDDT